jgi:hypothetical protein
VLRVPGRGCGSHGGALRWLSRGEPRVARCCRVKLLDAFPLDRQGGRSRGDGWEGKRRSVMRRWPMADASSTDGDGPSWQFVLLVIVPYAGRTTVSTAAGPRMGKSPWRWWIWSR